MVNLIAGEEIIPELVQTDFTPENVVARLNEILPDGPPRSKMIAGLAGVKARLKGSDQEKMPAADRAAEAILAMLSEPPAGRQRYGNPQ
jgi:lipid-A-disaccharide synthase